MESADQLYTETKVAGWMLAGTAVAAVALMGHHPTISSGTAALRIMHGTIMSVMLVQAVGLLLFVRRRPSALAEIAMFIFTLALIAGLTAGTIDGFVIPALLDNLSLSEHRPLFRLAWEANQAAATGGVLLTSIAYMCWSADVWQRGWRSTAVAGLAASLLPAIALLGGFVTMDIHGALFCYTAQAAWAAWLGIALIRARG